VVSYIKPEPIAMLSAVAFSLALPETSCHMATDKLMPQSFLKSMWTVQPEPLGVMKITLMSFGGTTLVSSLYNGKAMRDVESLALSDERHEQR